MKKIKRIIKQHPVRVTIVVIFSMAVAAYCNWNYPNIGHVYKEVVFLLFFAIACFLVNSIMKKFKKREPEWKLLLVVEEKTNKGHAKGRALNWKPPGCIQRRGGLGKRYIKE